MTTGFVVGMDHSQNGEQLVILKYFGDPKGTFLSAGENDGSTFSNVRALALLGWGGICIEPSIPAFIKLRNLYEDRHDIRCFNVAVSENEGFIHFYDSGTHLNKGDTSLLSTTRPEEMDRWKKSGEIFTKTTCWGTTIEKLISQAHMDHFDFISIDAEGMDYDILKQIDLTAVGCKMFCVEYNAKDAQKFVDYAAKFGMKLMHKNHENLIFAK